MIPYRTVFITSFFCIGLIVLVTMVKISQSLPDFSANSQLSSAEEALPLETDEAFFQSPFNPAPVEAHEAEIDEEKVIKKKVRDDYPMTARAYIVGDIQDGQVYIERNSDEALPVASMSKLVTALIATNKLSNSTTVEIMPEAASASPDTSNLLAGEKFTVQELMHPLLLSSSNVAAEALAGFSERTKFLESMSSYAWEIGMPDTFFADPSGLSSQNLASAKDIFSLAKYIHRSRPDILALTRNVRTSVATTSEHGSHQFVSTHPFVEDSRFVGGKTGRTPAAGDTMLTILNIQGRLIAFVVLGSSYDKRDDDTRLLIEGLEKILSE